MWGITCAAPLSKITELELRKQFGHIVVFTGYRPRGLNKQDVMEENREVDGDHQTLLRLSCNWS